MVIENSPMARKGHDHVCIGLGCFLLVSLSFLFFLESLFNECVLFVLLQLLLLFE